MKVSLLRGHPDERLTGMLEDFEPQFTYPLGEGIRFHITHGADGWRFFDALGEAAYAVAESGGRVLGVLGAALGQLARPDDSTAVVLYLGDLKIAADARGGLVLIHLIRAVQAWNAGRSQSAFAVVMDGTTMTPAMYTGRLGVPAFGPVDTVAILWLRTGGDAVSEHEKSEAQRVDNDQGLALFALLAAGQYRLSHTKPAVRSKMTPHWLVGGNGKACGRLEDTLRAKRLRTTSGDEMCSAHLSCFAYRHPEDGLRVLRAALATAAQAGYPLLFTAVARVDAVMMQTALGNRLRSLAPATVFGTGLTMPGRWNINTAEI